MYSVLLPNERQKESFDLSVVIFEIHAVSLTSSCDLMKFQLRGSTQQTTIEFQICQLILTKLKNEMVENFGEVVQTKRDTGNFGDSIVRYS